MSYISEICVGAVLLQSVGNYIGRRGRRRERRYSSLPSFMDIHEVVDRHLWNARLEGQCSMTDTVVISIYFKIKRA